MELLLLFALGASLTSHIYAQPTPGASNPSEPSSTLTSILESTTDNPEHIIVLDKSAPHPHDILDRIGLHADHADVRHVYNNAAFQGFAARVPNDTVHALGLMTDVTQVEAAVAVMSTRYRDEPPSTHFPHHRPQRHHPHPQHKRSASAQQPSSDSPSTSSSTTAQTRPNSPWGLQRISSTSPLPLDTPKTSLQYTYAYPPISTLGLNVDIYSIDSGLNLAAAAFTSRAKQGWSYTADSADYDGHGTHTAATAAGDTFGIATSANIVGVKVLDADGSGSSADTIAGMDYVIKQHSANKAANTNSGSNGGPFVATVMSMSWGLSKRSSAIDAAIAAASKVGIHITVAAGNSHGTDACTVSPSSLGGVNSAVISVGSLGTSNQISAFSNIGPCVDVYAPGEDVVSAWKGGETVANVLSGTSMSTPHVTGIVAVLASEEAGLAGSVGGMKGRVLSLTRTGVVGGDAGGGPSVIVNNGVVGGGGPAGVGKRDEEVVKRREGREDSGEWIEMEKREEGKPAWRGYKGYTLVDEGTSVQ